MIKLKVPLHLLREQTNLMDEPMHSANPLYYDALVAHAYQEAMRKETDADHQALIESIHADAQMLLHEWGVEP